MKSNCLVLQCWKMHSNFLEKHFRLLPRLRKKRRTKTWLLVAFFPINTRFIFLYLKENKGLNVNNNSAGNHQPKRKLIFLSDQRRKTEKGVKILCLTLLWGLAIVMTQTSWGVLRIVISLFEQFDFMFGIIAWPSISYFATSKENHFCGDFETFAWPKHSVWKFHKKCTLFYVALMSSFRPF